jgi:cellulose synthase (UDP-forming)
VTAKTKQSTGPEYRSVRPQLIAMGLLIVASAIGVARVINGDSPVLATVLTLIWVGADLALLAVVIPAARYQGPGEQIEDPFPATAELTSVLDDITDAEFRAVSSRVRH